MNNGKNQTPEELQRQIQELQLRVVELELVKRQCGWVEERLKAEKDRLQTVLDIAGVMIVAMDRRGMVTLINKRGSELLGLSQNELIGKNWFDSFIPENIREEVRQVFYQLIEGKADAPEYYENPVLAKGEERLIFWHNTLIRDEAGAIVGTLSSGEDVTERKKLEEARLQNLEFYRSLVKASPDAIFLFNTDSKVIMVNQRAASMFGFEKKEEAIGRDILEFANPSDFERVRQDLDRIMREGSVLGLEYVLRKRDGSSFTAELNGTLIKDAYGNVQAIMGTLRDISQRKQAEEVIRAAMIRDHTFEVLQDSKDYLDKIINSVADPIFVKDRQHRWILLNDAACALMGVSPQELIGKSDYDYFPRQEADVFWNRDEIVFETGKENVNEEQFTTAAGVVHTIITKKALYVDAKGQKYIVGIIRDVSDLKKAEEDRLKREILEIELAERKKAEAKLTESETQHRMTFDSMADAIHVIDADLRIVLLNENFRRWLRELGLFENLIGKSVLEAFPFLPERVAEEYHGVFQDGQVLVTEEVTNINGKDIVTETRKIPIVKEGKAIQVLTVIRDISERKAAEEKIKSALQQLTELGAIINRSPAVVLLWRNVPGYPVEFVSDNVRQFGYAPEEFLSAGLSLTAITHPEDAPRLEALMAEHALQQTKEFVREYRLYTKPGQIRWVEDRTLALRDSTGAITHYQGIILDISERKMAEQALRDNEQFLQNVFEGIQDGISILDIDLTVVRVNQWIEKMYAEQTPLVGKKCYEVYHQRSYICPWCPSVKAIKTGQMQTSIVPYTSQGELSGWLQLSAFPLRDNLGKIIGVIEHVRDITEQKKAEQDLRQSESRLRAIFEAADNISFVITDAADPEPAVLEFSPGAEAIFGYRRDEMIGNKVSALHLPEDVLKFPQIHKKLREEKKGIRGLTTLVRKNGERFPAFFSAYPLLDEKGHMYAALGVSIDISERKRVERDLLFTQFVVDHMGDSALWIDAKGNIAYVNEAACLSLGYTQGELRTKTIHEIDVNFPPELWQGQWQEIKRKKTSTFETKLRTKDGRDFPVEISSSYMQYEGEEYLCALIRDVTERERAEEALRRSEHDKTVILDTLSELVVYHDTRLRILWANKAASDDVGFRADELIGRYCYEVWQGRRTICKSCPAEKALKTGNFEQGEVLSPDGKCWFIRGYPIKDAAGKITGVVEVSLDVTQQKRAEQDSRLNLQRSRRILEETVVALAATAERRDPYTAGHQRRVAQLAYAIAKELGLDSEKAEGVRMAAIIHDVGKVYVPSEILSKPSSLTELELSIIKTHPQIGYEILEPVEFPWPVALIVLQHHERLDGSGYPHGLRSDTILLETKILTVADVVEAMASHRPYRAALGIDKALKEIVQNRGILYDSKTVDVCVKLFKKSRFRFE